MSVGGIVTEVIEVNPAKVWVNTRERYWNGKEYKEGEYCAIYCDPQGTPIMPGDKLWWQAGKAYWTSKLDQQQKVFKKIGFSGVNRP